MEASPLLPFPFQAIILNGCLFGPANYFRGKGDSHVNSSGMFGEKISPWRFQEETPPVLAVKVSFRVVFEEMLSSSF